MKVDWKARIQSKTFWVSLIALLMVLANQIASMFGVDVKVYSEQATEITETVLMILALIGIINEPKEKGDQL